MNMNLPDGVFTFSHDDIKAAPPTVKLWVIALLFGHPVDNVPSDEAITNVVEDAVADEITAREEAPPTAEEKVKIQAEKRSARAVKAAATRKANKEAKAAEAAGEIPAEKPEETVAEVVETPPAASPEPELAADADPFDVLGDVPPAAEAAGHPIDLLDDGDLPHMADIVKSVQSHMAAQGKDGVIAALAKLGKKKISECSSPTEVRELVKELSLDV